MSGGSASSSRRCLGNRWCLRGKEKEEEKERWKALPYHPLATAADKTKAFHWQSSGKLRKLRFAAALSFSPLLPCVTSPFLPSVFCFWNWPLLCCRELLEDLGAANAEGSRDGGNDSSTLALEGSAKAQKETAEAPLEPRSEGVATAAPQDFGKVSLAIQGLRPQRHRFLVFSQFTTMLDAVEFGLFAAEFPWLRYMRMDGRPWCPLHFSFLLPHCCDATIVLLALPQGVLRRMNAHCWQRNSMKTLPLRPCC